MEHNRYRLFADSPPDGPWHIYVHTPFCPRKCRFCMYYTMRSYSKKTKDALLDAVICEIRNYSRSSRAIMHGATSIYLGGGTPSELGPQRVSKLLEEVRNAFPIARDVEVTLETFPDINAENVLGEYSEAGVTRISMGVQSLNAAVLDASRRPATGIVEVSNVVAACHSLGLTVNIDLMYGLPLQTQGACMDSLKTIIDTRPDHITHYRCVNGPYSASFRLREVEIYDRMTPKELTQVDVEATDMLTREGFHEYAAGHYAKDAESVSVHECGEWAGESLVGLGPAAMSFVSGTLFKNAPNLKSYRKNVDTGQVHQPVELSRADIARRTALLNLAKLLRLDLNELMAKHGDAASQICQDVRRLGVLGYVQEVSPGVFVPNKGDISVTAFELSRFDTQGMSRRVLVGI